MRRIFTALMILAGLTPMLVKAQTSCTRQLTQARTIYAEGRIHEIEGILSGCLNDGFTDEEKTEAYRLLILSYIYLDEPGKADEAMLALLNHNHEFQINEQADPAEFINLYNTFRTWPIYLYGFKAGGTYSVANVQKLFGVNSSGSENTIYDAGLNFTAGLSFEKGFRARRVGLIGDLLFTNNQYLVKKEFSSDPVFDNLGNLIERDPFARAESTETKSWLSLDLAAYYRVLPKNKMDPRLFIGPSVSYLLTDMAEIETIFPLGGEPATGPDENLTKFRNRTNIGILAGINVRTKVGKNFLFFDARYIHGLVNITEFNFDQSGLSTFYGYALDDVKISYFSVSIGLLFQKYNPKKLKR